MKEKSVLFRIRVLWKVCEHLRLIAEHSRDSPQQKVSPSYETMSDIGSKSASNDAAPKRALFLMHNYNDIDHITPVVHALAETGEWNCSVLSYPMATEGSVDFDDDWRFSYVRERFNISVDRIEKVEPSVRALIGQFKLRELLTRWCDRTPWM